MCGNGALCATRLAAWLELAPSTGLTLETDAGEVEGRCLPDEEAAEIVAPPVGELTEPDIDLAPGEDSIHFTTVGVPHVIVRVGDLAAVPLLQRGRALRAHPVLPGGANVNFLANGDGGWAMRTYERGVEAETLACGTGAVAAMAVLAQAGQAEPPLQIRTASGTHLSISADLAPDRSLERPRLAGPAHLVFRAVLCS
jgi:diaminopimelate epimerase